MGNISKVLATMIMIRILSSLIEFSAAILMYFFNDVRAAIRINAILGIIGPIILIIVTFLGLVGIREQVNIKNLLLIFTGICFILLGTS